MTTKIITRAALLLSLTLVFQSLRFIIPVSPFVSTFIIGSMVNACLLLAAETVGLRPAVVIACIAPITAYFQSLLPLPIFILPVLLGNVAFVSVYRLLITKRALAVLTASVVKAVTLYFSLVLILMIVALPLPIKQNLLFIMSWPQFVTGIAGGVLAFVIGRRLITIDKSQ